MAVFKHLVERGVSYLREGFTDYSIWSRRMTGTRRDNIRPFLEEIWRWSVTLCGKKPDTSEDDIKDTGGK